MDTVKKTAWVTVDENMEFAEFGTMNEALGKLAIATFFEQEGTWVNGTYSNYAYAAHFINNAGEKTDSIYVNNWRIIGPRIYTGEFYAKEVVLFDLMDPMGITQERMFGKSRNGIRSGLLFLKEAANFTSWEDYLRSLSNPTKNIASVTLEQQIQQLQAENSQLKEKLEAIRLILGGLG